MQSDLAVEWWNHRHREPPRVTYDLRHCSRTVVEDLCARYHAYQGAGKCSTYCFAVFENNRPVAAFAWQPPPPGAAKAICPEAPQGVLALSRMVAVDRSERRLKHISKPLRRQMLWLLDRTRWPALVTYSDESVGHTGHVYLCSGWEKTLRAQRAVFQTEDGRRASKYANGLSGSRNLIASGYAWIQRWEHWACRRGSAGEWMQAHGWARVAIEGKKWKSGSQAYTYTKTQLDTLTGTG